MIIHRGVHLLVLLHVQQRLAGSCTGKTKQEWNRENLAEELSDWVESIHEGDYVVDDGDSKRTVGKVSGSVIQGLAWQWRGDHRIDGFLYGRVDRWGRFTGSNITFLYPDLLTGM